MKALTLAVFALFCASLVWAQGDPLITQKYETDNATIYRMTADDWGTCMVLHGALEHDEKGWYCAVEKRAPLDGGDGLTLLSTGNVDRLHYSEVQVVNPDPAGAPLTVPIVGVELHFMDMGQGFWPIDLRIYFPLMPNNARNVENCVEWFTKTQNRELALNIRHEPGNWDGTKSPWPYFQVAINPKTQQIHTWTVDGAEIWLWSADDVQCWLADDNLAPYWQNPDGVRGRTQMTQGGTDDDGIMGGSIRSGDGDRSSRDDSSIHLAIWQSALTSLLANPKWHVLTAWDGAYRAAK